MTKRIKICPTCYDALKKRIEPEELTINPTWLRCEVCGLDDKQANRSTIVVSSNVAKILEETASKV